jgi:hypothetical protein
VNHDYSDTTDLGEQRWGSRGNRFGRHDAHRLGIDHRRIDLTGGQTMAQNSTGKRFAARRD